MKTNSNNKKRLLMITMLLLILTMSIFSCKNVTKNEDGIETKIKFFNDKKMHTIKFIPYQDNLWKSMEADKSAKDKTEKSTYEACKLEIDGINVDSVGIRFKGESSFDFQTNKKKAFKLKFDQFIKKQKYQGLQILKLNNNFKDPSFMREKLMLDILKSENLPSPRSSYCKVYFKDEYLGLYLAVEEIDKVFLKKNFEHKKGNLYFGEPRANLTVPTDSTNALIRCYRKKTNKKKTDFSDLAYLINTINSAAPEAEYVKNLDAVFNTEDCLKQWAINNFFVNIDAYNMLYPHNYFLYYDYDVLKPGEVAKVKEVKPGKKSKKKKHHGSGHTSGKANWIGYDYNYAFGGWSPKYKLSQIYDFDILFVNNPSKDYPLAQKMLKDIPTYRKLYLNYMNKFIESKIESEWLDSRIDSYYALIKDAVYEDKNKFKSSDDFDLNIEETLGNEHELGEFTPGLKKFIEERTKAVKIQLKNNK